MKPFLISITIILIFLTSSCAKIFLYSYDDCGISSQSIDLQPGSRSHKMGHLLEESHSLVLNIEIINPGNYFIIDDELCDSVILEIPKAGFEKLPVVIENPNAYFKHCSCVWGNCVEEKILDGKVVINKLTDEGIHANVKLGFPSKTIKQRGLFIFKSPPNFIFVENEDVN